MSALAAGVVINTLQVGYWPVDITVVALACFLAHCLDNLSPALALVEIVA